MRSPLTVSDPQPAFNVGVDARQDFVAQAAMHYDLRINSKKRLSYGKAIYLQLMREMRLPRNGPEQDLCV